MSQDKKPIWERQGRPKPLEIGAAPVGDGYSRTYRRWTVCHWNRGGWRVYAPTSLCGTAFPTFAEAITYADRQARR